MTAPTEGMTGSHNHVPSGAASINDLDRLDAAWARLYAACPSARQAAERLYTSVTDVKQGEDKYYLSCAVLSAIHREAPDRDQLEQEISNFVEAHYNDGMLVIGDAFYITRASLRHFIESGGIIGSDNEKLKHAAYFDDEDTFIRVIEKSTADAAAHAITTSTGTVDSTGNAEADITSAGPERAGEE